MIYVKPRVAAEMTLSVTTSATPLMTLIDTAGSGTSAGNYYLAEKLCNVVRITPTTGSIRYGWGIDPTTANGAYLGNGNYEYIAGDLSNLRLISTSGTATVSIVYYRANGSELAAIAGGGGGGGGASSGVYAEDSAATSGDNVVAMGAVRQDTLATSTTTDGDYSWVKQDVLGAAYGREVYATTAEDNTVGVFKVEQRFSYSYISSATTTTVKSGAGFLNAITITEAVASTIIVYDNTAGSGTIIASFVASAGVGTYHFNVSFGTGLTIVTAGASKLTTSYR
ncbi:MAG TPA: hypothetical protein PLQ98_00965 [Bacillota bacterium]|nr:hypothetical protein [Bacillota bacterium]